MILGILSGLAAFGFLLAGFVGMVEFDCQDRSEVDLVVTGGIFSALKDIGENWELRPEQRRLVYVGLVCSIVSAACLVLSQMDEEDAPNKPPAGNAGIASRLAIGHPWPGVPEPTRCPVPNATCPANHFGYSDRASLRGGLALAAVVHLDRLSSITGRHVRVCVSASFGLDIPGRSGVWCARRYADRN